MNRVELVKKNLSDTEFIQLIKLLLKNDYILSIFEDEYCYSIEFNYGINSGLGDKTLQWLTEDELFLLNEIREKKRWLKIM